MHRNALRIVLDPDDSPEHAKFLAALHDLSQGRVYAEIRTLSDASSLATAAWDVLFALGKQPDVHGETTPTWQAMEWMASWLRAHGVSKLIINRAHALNWRDWQALTELAYACDLRTLAHLPAKRDERSLPALHHQLGRRHPRLAAVPPGHASQQA